MEFIESIPFGTLFVFVMSMYAVFSIGKQIGYLDAQLNIHLLADKIPSKSTRYIKNGVVYTIRPMTRNDSQ
jgi:hypothetical protein